MKNGEKPTYLQRKIGLFSTEYLEHISFIVHLLFFPFLYLPSFEFAQYSILTLKIHAILFLMYFWCRSSKIRSQNIRNEQSFGKK